MSSVKLLLKILLGVLVGIILLAVIGSQLEPARSSTRSDTPREQSSPVEATAPKPAGYISRADHGDAWPFTVDEATLECLPQGSPRLAVVLKAGGQVYGLNGSAKDAGFQDASVITRNRGAINGVEVVARVAESARRAIFAEAVACEDAGAGVDGCKERVRQRHKVTAEEFRHILNEGLLSSWPPLEPRAMDVSAFIKQGLALCPQG